MKIIDLSQTNSVINCYMAQLRDVNRQTNRAGFRNNLQRIGQVMAYEISRQLDYSAKTIRTPLGQVQVNTCDNRIVIGTVLRAGLAFHEGFLHVFDEADCGFVAAYRVENGTRHPDIHLEYIAAPSLEQSVFLLVDPMLATGISLETAWRMFRKNGTPAQMHICTVISSRQGVEHLQTVFDDNVTLWTAAIDPELNDEAYIVPGLGDAGDCSFGPKL